MKKTLIVALCAVCLSLNAAESGAKAKVTSAAKALSEKPNYSWKTTVEVPEGSRFHPGPTEGKAEKNGLAQVVLHFGDNTTEAIFQGKKAAVTSGGEEWQSLADLETSEGPRRFLAILLQNFKTPAEQAQELASAAKDLQQSGEGPYAGDLTEEGAKKLLTWRSGGNEGPSVSNASGSVKFWIKDGVLSKYQFKLKGTMSFNGNDIDTDRTTTVEIKDVGTTKISIPEEAKKKLT